MPQVDAALGGQALDGLEAAAELGRRGPRRQLGVDADVAGDVDDGEQQVAELVGDLAGVAAGDGLAQLGQLLVDLGQRAGDVGPVEADLGRLARELLGVGERRQRRRHAVEDRRAPLLGPLDVLPVGDDRAGVVGDDVAEHVRVAAHELVVDRRR